MFENKTENVSYKQLKDKTYEVTIKTTSEKFRADSSGNEKPIAINDWIDVQDNQYRFIAIEEMGKLIIRIVIAEYFACEVTWEL